MASRFPQRSDPRSTLFAAYDSKTRKSTSPASHASTPPYGAQAHAYPSQQPPHPGKSSPSPYRHSTSTPGGPGSGAGAPSGAGGSPYSSYSNTTSSAFTSWSGPGGSGSSFRSSSAPNGGAGNLGYGDGEEGATFRSATPNSKGQYSDAVLNELESQNEEHLQGMTAKVRMLKDITTQIGHEIRSSSTLAEQLNENFEGATLKLKGTVNRMMRMAERGTGVGWRTWVLFFAAVILLFWWVKGRGR